MPIEYTPQQLITELSKYVIEYNDKKTTSRVAIIEPQLPDAPLPNHVVGLAAFLEQFEEIKNQLSASNGPRYWGYVTGGANPIATLADWLVTLFNQNVANRGDSIAPLVEQQAIDWLCSLLYLPEQFKGIITTGATAANLLGTFVARQHLGNIQGLDIAKQGLTGLDIKVFSATPHASMIKCLGMAGLGQSQWCKVATLDQSEAMDPEDLSRCLEKSHNKGKWVIASAGTVTGTDYDDLKLIASLCKKHNAFLHVDAAFGIFERLVNTTHRYTQGIELADSITLDCHKWLNVPYDSGVFLTRHINDLYNSCNVNAPYLANTSQELPFMSLGIENSRRFRALPIWATLIAYGRQGVKESIQNNIDQAKQLAQWLEQSLHYTLVKPCQLNVVVFSVSKHHPLENDACLEVINNTGEVFMTPGNWQGEPIIRAALSNWSTTYEDVDSVIGILNKITEHA
jgi:glutamate/tyrosine decarboxylase-like PLP-dependent enzyme